MTAGATWMKGCFLVVLCCAVSAAAMAESPAEKARNAADGLDGHAAANATEPANATWCVGHEPSFSVNSSSNAVIVAPDEPQREGQWTCVCAINALLAHHMKEIACSREGAVRLPPLCRSAGGGTGSIYIGGLTAETNYTVCVRYLCAGENASAVACQPTTTEPIPKSEPAPPPPFGVIVKATATSTAANVTWSTDEAAHGFTVTLWKLVTHRTLEHVPVESVRTNETHCEFHSLEPYTIYRAEVSTVAPNVGIIANATVFRTQPGAPTAPRYLQLTGVSSTAISLHWSAPQELRGPLFGYTVFYGPAREHQKRSSLETQNTSVTVTHLTPDTFFEVYVKAFNKLHDGTEVASVPARIEVKTSIGAPSKVQNLRVVSRSKNTVVVSWSAPLKSNGPLDGYVVHWCNQSSSGGHDDASYAAWMAKLTNNSECHTLKSARETRATVGPLIPESTYVVAVSAYNLQADRHQWIESSPETVTVETLPEAPPALRALDVRMVSADSVEANWESPAPGIVGYVVAWCQNQRCSEKTVTVTRLIIHNLHADSDYNVSVVPFRMDSQNTKVLGPLTTKLVTVTDNIDAVMADSYLIGAIVCSVIITALGFTVFVVCRKKRGTGPQLYKRMSSLENDDDDIVFMKTVPRRT
ncbi:receptor-type tyrosine-protein phosphatase F-like isoform X1 [Dermacentor andersoni]|uniref:receptor-type tyrosine-protein phosphatase F-like isoform X1 n=1 Tax=Dermacentor andersoni TaxID=34620 RepID=UPI00215582A5|nr:receptor-type tyrosine-protein phosphatase delta-like isoform X1 [Dermacentor andersoni]